jgi:hypothetical protein
MKKLVVQIGKPTLNAAGETVTGSNFEAEFGSRLEIK